MKKTLLTFLLFFCGFWANAQDGTGKFTYSKNTNEIIITQEDGTPLSANPTKKYESLILIFPADVFTGTKIEIFNEGISLLKGPKKIGTEIGVKKGTDYHITIVQNGNNYVVSTLKDDELGNSFSVKVGDVSTLFTMASLTDDEEPKQEDDPEIQPGYILYDALYIAENIGKHKNDVIRSILLHYDITSGNISQNNYLKDIDGLADELQSGGGDKVLSSANLLSSIGNLDVTNFADGLAKFIVDRTKQELNIAFFNKFKEVLSDPRYVDLKTVFPETYEVLMVIDNQIYNYDDYLQALRNAFDRDLSDLPANLPSIIDNHSSYFNANPSLKVILQSSFYIAQQVQLKEHPGQMIANYPVNEFMGTSDASGNQTGINQNIAPSFKTLQLISKSFKSKTDSLTHYWASDSLIKKLFNDDDAVKIYIGLLEQQAKKDAIAFEGKELWKIIDDSYAIKRGYEEYKNFFRTVSSQIRDIENEIDALTAIDNDSLKIEKYHDIAGKALDLMDHLITVEKMPYFPQDLNIEEIAGIYIYSARTASDIVIDVNRKQYASAIMKTVMLYDTIFQKDVLDTFIVQAFEAKYAPKAITLRKQKSDLQAKNKKLTAEMAGKTPTEEQKNKLQDLLSQEKGVSEQLAKVISDYTDSKRFEKWEDSIRNELSMTMKSLLKYGTFMSAIIDAKTSDDVEAAIEAAALPVGSARIKRESTFNIALNAYCGPYMGYERVYDLDPKWMSAKKSTINSYGLTAPVGISISYGGNHKNVKNHASYSLFLSVIDIGAIASFRFTDTTTEVLPTIQLKNILSPGIFFSYGIPALPISVNAGWQMGPLLRKVDAEIDENTYSERYGRVSLSICVDIPIVNFYTFTSAKKPKSGL